MWLEQIDKKNNHKTNILGFFCFFFKKNISLYTVSNLTELLSWTEWVVRLEEELWLDHGEPGTSQAPKLGRPRKQRGHGRGGEQGWLPALSGPPWVSLLEFPKGAGSGCSQSVRRAQKRQHTKSKNQRGESRNNTILRNLVKKNTKVTPQRGRPRSCPSHCCSLSLS